MHGLQGLVIYALSFFVIRDVIQPIFPVGILPVVLRNRVVVHSRKCLYFTTLVEGLMPVCIIPKCQGLLGECYSQGAIRCTDTLFLYSHSH